MAARKNVSADLSKIPAILDMIRALAISRRVDESDVVREALQFWYQNAITDADRQRVATWLGSVPNVTAVAESPPREQPQAQRPRAKSKAA